jgi:hypothetical protein
MPRSSFPPRMMSHVSESLKKRLDLYSLAASTAGLSILALAQPAEAEIVYTAANIKITQNGGLIKFDLNHDGIPDFGLSNVYFHSSFQANGFLKVEQAQSANEVWEVTSKGFLCASALPRNVRVGPKGHFQKDPKAGLAMAFTNLEGTYYGPWLKVKQAYLGLKFVVMGKIHFGWARVNVKFSSSSIAATLTGYAYETIPNKPIVTGKTQGPDEINAIGQPVPTAFTAPAPQRATLGLLALGSRGLSIWRREESGREN